MRSKELTKSVLSLTRGVFSALGDFLVFYFLMMEHQVGKSKTSRGVWQAYYEAEADFQNYKEHTFRSSVYSLKKKNLIRFSSQENKQTIEITETGRKKLTGLLPQYEQKRIWDNKLYLVTYDISEDRKKDREFLRNQIKQLGMGMLQKSVWITPYNPKEILKEFLKDRYLSGSVIISDIGKDGAIGEYDLRELITKVYQLEKISQRYEEFINKTKNLIRPNPWLKLEYLSILKDDPQLPFELLSSWWKGEEAYKIYQCL